MLTLVQWQAQVSAEIQKVYFGSPRTLELLLTGVLCEGHILLEDVPGVGKTLLAKALAKVLGGSFNRIQCTPDLTPSDVLGFSVYNPVTGGFDFREGPIMSNILLVDEINRASPRTQSALLEAMAEGQVSREGHTDPLPKPFLVLATENPVEFEGTFPLPEAQKDRFMLSFSLGFPDREQESQIMGLWDLGGSGVGSLSPLGSLTDLTTYKTQVSQVHCDPLIKSWILDLVEATRKDSDLALGISPRGTQALFRGAKALASLRGRDYIIPEDVKDLWIPVGLKRLILPASSSLKGQSSLSVLNRIMSAVPTPALREN